MNYTVKKHILLITKKVVLISVNIIPNSTGRGRGGGVPREVGVGMAEIDISRHRMIRMFLLTTR